MPGRTRSNRYRWAAFVPAVMGVLLLILGLLRSDRTGVAVGAIVAVGGGLAGRNPKLKLGQRDAVIGGVTLALGIAAIVLSTVR